MDLSEPLLVLLVALYVEVTAYSCSFFCSFPFELDVKEETGLQRCFCLNLLSLFVRKYGNISFVGKCLYPIEQKATSIIMLCNLAIKSYQPS